MKIRKRIQIRGVVQGVGFRPYIRNLAHRFDLSGWVLNHSGGVTIEAEAETEILEQFLTSIPKEKPVHSFISRMEIADIDLAGDSGFEIRVSETGEKPTALILPDLATCPECLAELTDPKNRRFRYPFLNCTHCGPRYSIIQKLPYDRPNTTMKQFRMCAACKAEYENPDDRRFHAQPTACPECGPQLDFKFTDGKVVGRGDKALLLAEDLIRNGNILAMKGLGGFQLLCDARSDSSVKTLRKRKNREEKPLAVMVPDIETAHQFAELSQPEIELLTSSEAPVVLVRQKKNSGLSPLLNPGNPYIGLILPYTPLHHLLMADLQIPLVCTSGNRSDDPICTNEEEAALKLGAVADGFLNHNREIQRYIDDSVARIIHGELFMIRRARGYAPLPEGQNMRSGKSLLAVGAHLKNTISVSDGSLVCTSQHIGDMSTITANLAFESAILDLSDIYRIKPEQVLADLHPDYYSTRHAAQSRLPVIHIQHHEAHIAGSRAENNVTGEALGIAWDGTGLGSDGTVWGGEFFHSDDSGISHIGQFVQFPLAGGDTAVRDVRRSALGILVTALPADQAEKWLVKLNVFTSEEMKNLHLMIEKKLNTVMTSSAGRLFDGVSALLHLRKKSAYEGQAAMELEFISDPDEKGAYSFSLVDGNPFMLDWRPMISEILTDIDQNVPVSEIGGKFHRTMVNIMISVAKEKGYQQIVVGGGCFQNKILLENLISASEANGIKVFWPHHIPTNDGGISFGQIAWVVGREGLGKA